MPDLLFIKWDNDNDHFDHPIVDEQHRGLIATINSLYYFIQNGWAIKDLKPTIEMLEHYVIFHIKTEESILVDRGITAKDLEVIKNYGGESLKELGEIVKIAIRHEEPNELTSYLAKWWLDHKSQFHNKLIKYIKHQS